MIDLNGRVAIVTGAGGGLGRSHALLLASRGAKVVVNDLGSGAQTVVDEIHAAGGQARAVQCSVADAGAVQAMVDAVLADWGRIDILVNNAGILRDKSFAKMGLDDFRLVVDVHLMGSANCTKAVWNAMREQNYGRVVMTTSCSGLYGNFGQANYAAAKMGLVGLMQTLGIEGEKHNIRVNCLAPTGKTKMMEGILPDAQLSKFKPELVSPAVLALVSEQAPNRAILSAGAGGFELVHIAMTQGIELGESASAEAILQRWNELADRTNAIVPSTGFEQAQHELKKGGFEV
ncbi:MAG: SDR family NAD(P)-dependent oxidoreductase [Thermomonas sp.]|uniref:SDR family NAD(P)-dependent oxidoreductase n=1 Tax=Thermomonas sp. TaxID=1971895 RepID=UPI001EC3231E|nr:SDR family NAD(P)-dependent oxidoreductase [Thermomonas sp.]MBV2208503.1 SDR family NAD(P)-dependent oxidoreductase [Thermomonas sp.]